METIVKTREGLKMSKNYWHYLILKLLIFNIKYSFLGNPAAHKVGYTDNNCIFMLFGCTWQKIDDLNQIIIQLYDQLGYSGVDAK